MSTLSPRPLLPAFIPSINALLAALALPFTLGHPTDLTPSLLLAVFESLINARLPIPPSVRQSRTRDAKSRAMLVLLGVLECDILRGGIDALPDTSIMPDDSALAGAGGVSVDGWADEIGLGQVDPERLADGGWEETIFIGELLCWLARRKGILPRKSASPRPSSPSQDADPDWSALSLVTDIPRHPLVCSPEPSFSTTVTTGSDLSIRARTVSSRTSVSNPHHDSHQLDEASQDTIQMYDARQMMQDAEMDDDRPPSFRPRCIHELEDPSYIRALGSFDTSSSREHVSEVDSDEPEDDPHVPPTPTPRRVRLAGWIDADIELRQFAASQTRSGAGPPLSAHTRAGMLYPRTDVSSRAHPRLIPSPTPHRISPSPSPSPPRSSIPKHPPIRVPPSPSPPPSPSDPPFDVSFSTLNNTSTPAKPRTSRRPPPQIPTQTRATGRTPARSPSYTPSPPSFSTSSRARQAGSSSTPIVVETSPSTSSAPVPSSTTRRSTRAPSPPTPALSTSRARSSNSTAMTNTLLTERARLLTELAALKRARAVSGGGGTHAGTRGSSRGVVGHHVGVGV